ncbi:hypothetical protein MMPV_003720 [Pyropia vietnamensis]
MAAAFVPAGPWLASPHPLGSRFPGRSRPRRAAVYSFHRRTPPQAAAAAASASASGSTSASPPPDGDGGGGGGKSPPVHPASSRFVVAPLSAGAPAGAVQTIAAMRAGAFSPFPTATPDEARRSVAAILTRQLSSTVCEGDGGRGYDADGNRTEPVVSPAYALVTLIDPTPPPSLAGWVAATGVGGLPVAAVDVEVYGPGGEARSVGWLLDELRAGEGGPGQAPSPCLTANPRSSPSAGVGSTAALPPEDEWVYLSSMAVDEEYRRQGLARLLLTTVLAAIGRHRRGGRLPAHVDDGRGGHLSPPPPPSPPPPRSATGGVALHVRPDNGPARRLYERAGFVSWRAPRPPPGGPPSLLAPAPAPAWLTRLAADGDLLLRLDEDAA